MKDVLPHSSEFYCLPFVLTITSDRSYKTVPGKWPLSICRVWLYRLKGREGKGREGKGREGKGDTKTLLAVRDGVYVKLCSPSLGGFPLFSCGFLDMLVFEEKRLVIELRKKLSTKKPTADLMPFSDLKPLTANYVYQIWQKKWDETVSVSDKFHEILPKLPDKLLPFHNTRKLVNWWF